MGIQKGKRLAQRKNIEVDVDILEWLADTYPGVSLWWLVNALLRKFKDLHRGKGNRLNHMIRESAVLTKGDM